MKGEIVGEMVDYALRAFKRRGVNKFTVHDIRDELLSRGFKRPPSKYQTTNHLKWLVKEGHLKTTPGTTIVWSSETRRDV